MITYEKNRSLISDYYYRQYDTNLNFEQHFHDSFEFIYVVSGSISITISDKEYEVKEKKGLLILPNQIHSYKTDKESKTFIFIFSSSYVAKYYKTSLLYCAKNPILDISGRESLINDLQNIDDPFLFKSNLYYLVYLYSNQEMIERKDDFGTISKAMISYIDENYSSKISLKNIADNLGYNYHYLSSLFNNSINCNFQSFINEYRINKFCELLIDDHDSPINELAFKVGYTSLRTFNRNFFHIKKCTPKEYRINLIEKKDNI